MRSQLNYSSYPKILPIIIQYNQAILMHGGIYRCTGIYFFKSAIFFIFLFFKKHVQKIHLKTPVNTRVSEVFTSPDPEEIL